MPAAMMLFTLLLLFFARLLRFTLDMPLPCFHIFRAICFAPLMLLFSCYAAAIVSLRLFDCLAFAITLLLTPLFRRHYIDAYAAYFADCYCCFALLFTLLCCCLCFAMLMLLLLRYMLFYAIIAAAIYALYAIIDAACCHAAFYHYFS